MPLESSTNSLNLQNGKLLYMNRALKSNSLNERQKETIVENISKVSSISEAKLVFETLQKQSNVRGIKIPTTLNEAIAINKGNVLSFRQTKEIESIDPNKERMQKLAGINKKD